ncbi:MAG: formate--tetrahydrofolate ligase, partial [Candidatus Heimdallarchaeota archaeon]|nr:formate--tetrahydrofolate ligase [Candidatus Heimdallarchaeota archaeon]
MNDIDIAHSIKIKPIAEIAQNIDINSDELISYGPYKAKVKLDILKRLSDKPDGKYILVTAMTPTPLGEGKTVNSIGLSLGLNKIGQKSIVNLRQPSMGPIFGIKGGAAGGGYSQVLPLEDVNLGLTGDIHSVSIAHNLCSAFIDNSLLRKNPLHLNTNSISFKRVVDLNDRALRDIVVGMGGKSNGITRQTGFIISVASELMAVLALAENIFDLRKRLGRMIIGYNMNGEAVTADDLNVAGAMTVLLRDAILPNLLQTSENSACFIHTGPFANIAHGNSSIIADRIALKLADYVVTEAGFGA